MLLDAWIAREFGGHGVAIRRQEEPPIPGEPFMSMQDAKELTRRAVAEFGSAPKTCDLCSTWAARSRSQLENRLRKMEDAPDVLPCPCPRCGSTAWATTLATPGRFRCCLETPDPGPWQAGVDDAAEPAMVERMHSIRDNLSYRTPIFVFIRQLHAAVNIDNRTLLGQDIQRCLLANAAARLTLLAENVDPYPWRTLRENLRDAWAVLRRRAVAIHVRGTVYEDWKPKQ